MNNIYYEGVRLGALEEVNVSKISKAEARGLYMDREDVVLDLAPEVEVEKVQTEVWRNGVRVS